MLGPDQKIYFSTSTEIYQYDISGPAELAQPSSSWTINYVAIAVAVVAIAIVLVVSRLRHQKTINPEPGPL